MTLAVTGPKSRAPASWMIVPVVVLGVLLEVEGSPLRAEEPGRVWLINTRGLSPHAAASKSYPPLRYRRLSADGTWAEAGPGDFFATDDPAVPTCVFVHGNRETSRSAISKGVMTCRRLTAGQQDRPLRFVIWSWPTEQVCRRNRADLRLKAARSDREAYLLAHMLKCTDPAAPMTLVGYSFGARVITGALHLLGGGEVAGRALDRVAKVKGRPWRAVLVAAAMPNDWLLPGHCNGLALPQLEAALVLVNPCDPVLRWYPRLYSRGGPEALGYTGPAAVSRLGADREKLDLLGVGGSVGKNHSWQAYLSSGGLLARTADYVFSAGMEQAAVATGSDPHARVGTASP